MARIINKINGTTIAQTKLKRSDVASGLARKYDLDLNTLDNGLIELEYQRRLLKRNIAIQFSKITLKDHINIASDYLTLTDYRKNESKSYNWSKSTNAIHITTKHIFEIPRLRTEIRNEQIHSGVKPTDPKLIKHVRVPNLKHKIPHNIIIDNNEVEMSNLIETINIERIRREIKNGRQNR